MSYINIQARFLHLCGNAYYDDPFTHTCMAELTIFFVHTLQAVSAVKVLSCLELKGRSVWPVMNVQQSSYLLTTRYFIKATLASHKMYVQLAIAVPINLVRVYNNYSAMFFIQYNIIRVVVILAILLIVLYMYMSCMACTCTACVIL